MSRPPRSLALVLILSPLMIGCSGSQYEIAQGARDVLLNAEIIEVFSLQPVHTESVPVISLHGWEVLGSTTIKDSATRQRLIADFLRADAENDGSLAAACFEPRHAIRVTADSINYDFVICFECLQVAAYIDEKRTGYFHISDSPRRLFNGVLRSADIEIAPSIDESVTKEEQSETGSNS